MDLTRLIPIQKYDCNAYLQLLVKLFPVGIAWNRWKSLVPPYSPLWVELPTWQEDSFENYYISACWDVIFRNNYKLYIHDDQFVAIPSNVLYSGDYAKLTSVITGDFIIEYGIMKLDLTNVGGIRVVDDLLNPICEFGVFSDTVILYDETHSTLEYYTIPYNQYQIINLRIIRTAGTLSFQYKVDDNWYSFTTTIVNSDDIILQAKATIDQTGFAYLQCQASTGFANKYYAPTSTFGTFLCSIAAELCRFERYVLKLIRESVPGLSKDLLEKWEAIAGLPDESTPVGLTVEQRQAQVHAKVTQAKGEWTGTEEFLPLCADYYIGYAETLNMTITISSSMGGAPFRVTTKRQPSELQRVTRTPLEGIDGARLYGLHGMSVWVVTVITDPDSNRAILEAVFDKIRPAHTIVVFEP